MFQKLVDKARSSSDRSRILIHVLVVLPLYLITIALSVVLDKVVFKGAGLAFAMVSFLYFFAFVLSVETHFYENVLRSESGKIRDPLTLTYYFFSDFLWKVWKIIVWERIK